MGRREDQEQGHSPPAPGGGRAGGGGEAQGRSDEDIRQGHAGVRLGGLLPLRADDGACGQQAGGALAILFSDNNKNNDNNINNTTEAKTAVIRWTFPAR